MDAGHFYTRRTHGALGVTLWAVAAAGWALAQVAGSDPPEAVGLRPAPTPGPRGAGPVGDGPAPRRARTVDAWLFPVESVTPGRPRRVSFGLPLPSAALDDPSQIRVVIDGSDLPAVVQPLTRWRSIDVDTQGGAMRPAQRGGWRAVLVQCDVTFPRGSAGLAAPRPLRIELNRGPRPAGDPDPVPVRTTWVSVNDVHWPDPPPRPVNATPDSPGTGTVSEPCAYAVYPVSYYADCQIRDAALLPLGTHPDLALWDAAAPYFGMTELDRVDPRVTRLQGFLCDDPASLRKKPGEADLTAEPWLYDRATTVAQIGFRHADADGRFLFLREAHRLAQFYADNLGPDGTFTPKRRDLAGTSQRDARDPKYSYAEACALDYWLTGDPRLPGKVAAAASAGERGLVNRGLYRPGTRQWTERHTAIHFLNNVVAWELTGQDEALGRVQSVWENLLWMQDGAGAERLWPAGAARVGRLTPGQPSGGLLHTTGEHHEGAGGLVTSPWMCALLADAVDRYHARSGDPRASRFLRRLADFLATEGGVALYRTDVPKLDRNVQVPLLLPYYLAGVGLDGRPLKSGDERGLGGGQHGGDTYQDVEHTRDVASLFARAYRHARREGLRDDAGRYLATVRDLVQSHQAMEVPHFLRARGVAAGMSTFRLSNARKLGWWYRTSASVDADVGADTRLAGPDAPALTVWVTSAPPRVVPGGQATVTVFVRNDGAAPALAPEVRLTLQNRPAEFAFVARSPSGGGVARTDMAGWQIGSLAPGAAASRSVTLRRLKDDAAAAPGRPLDPLFVTAAVYHGAPGDPAGALKPGAGPLAAGRYPHAAAGRPLVVPRRPG